MGHEISQFDIPDRHLLAANAQPRTDRLMDIGEAKITRTIFGRAKVRVIRERDKKRRAWLLTGLAVMVIAAAAWQGWIAFQQMQSAAPPLPLSERIRVSPPAFQSEDIPSTPSSARDRQRTPTQIVIDGMTTRREPAPPQLLGLKASRQMADKPVTAQPLTAGKPQTASPATQPESIRPAATAPLVVPSIKGDTPALSPAGGNQPAGPVNAKP